MAPVICQRNKFGHCKFGNSCINIHLKETCENTNCRSYSCEKRHPKKCTWFNKYGRCKFSPCSYRHDIQNSSFGNNSEIVDIKERLVKIEETLSNVTEQLRFQSDLPFECEVCNHKVGTQKKLKQHIRKKHGDEADLNKRLEADLNETVEDETYKESLEKIVQLERFVVRLKEKVDLLEIDKAYYMEEWNEDSDLTDIIKRHTSLTATCTKCGFDASNKATLKSHISSAHVHTNYKFYEKPLTEEEIIVMSESEKQFLLAGPSTPKSESLEMWLREKRQQEQQD